MARVSNYRKLGDTYIVRMDGIPPEMRQLVTEHLHAFAKTHGKYVLLCDTADGGRTARDTAITAIGKADKAVDQAVLTLADRLVGAGLGTRKNPFAAFSPYAPTALTQLAADKIGKAVADVVQQVLAQKPPADVVAAAKQCTHAVAAFEASRQAAQKVQASFAVAMAERDGWLPDWQKDANRLKRHAEAAWLDYPGTWQAVFGR